jgi:hypothetical protein
VSDLTCDCSPAARPRIREADKLRPGPFGPRLYVRCDECGRIGGLGDNAIDARWSWENEERTVEE